MLDLIKRLPFLKLKGEKREETQTSGWVLPEGFVREREFSPFPLYRFLVSKESLLLLKGYHLVFDQPPSRFFTEGVEFVKYPPCGGKVWTEEELRNSIPEVRLPRIGDTERVVAEKLVRKFYKSLEGITPVCEKELASLVPPEGKVWLHLKLFKDWKGWTKLTQLSHRAREKGKDLDICGVFALLVEEFGHSPLEDLEKV